tara:strand:+ start:361 stop:558 length:198 start_codon:yes stop_codon:yes gene_type:complete
VALPYKKNSELPDSVLNVLPAKAQDIFRETFNSVYREKDEVTAFKIAWSAVKKKYKKKGKKWVKK